MASGPVVTLYYQRFYQIELLTYKQAAEKVGFVIPNQRRLRVRDLLFARKPRRKQIPHSVQKTERGSE
jgi:hypothetical protein